jgi:hypothetical protein
VKNGPAGPKRAGWQHTPQRDRLDPARPDVPQILAAHERALASGLSTYRDPATGYTVMTSRYLAERDYCCNNLCRHCPWAGGEVNPEPEPEERNPG